jgi:hypothetical protein
MSRYCDRNRTCDHIALGFLSRWVARSTAQESFQFLWIGSTATHDSAHYPSSCLLFKTQLNSIGLSVPHRKHNTSPLQAQQVNAIYRFVTMVVYINITIAILDTIHRLVIVLFYIKPQCFGDWYFLRFQVEPTDLGPIERASPCFPNQSE